MIGGSGREAEAGAEEGSGRARSLAEQALLEDREEGLQQGEALPPMVLTPEGARQLNALTDGIVHDLLGLVCTPV